MAQPHPLIELYLTRLREFAREPARIFWVYAFPTILAICLGLAFTGNSTSQVAIDLVSNERTPRLEEWIKDYHMKPRGPERPEITYRLWDREAAIKRARSGRSILVVEPAESPMVIYHYDPTRAEALSAKAAIDDVIQEANGRRNPIPTGDSLIQEPGSRYIDFLIPGLIGLNTMGGGLWGIGFLLVNFRKGKLLKRLQATPMPRRDFLLAILGARLTFLLPDLIVFLSLGVFAFGMPIRGSLALIVFVAVVGALAFAGIGLLVASRVRTTESVNGLMNLVMLPMWLFSGVFFSSERFPEVMQPFIHALPLTQLLNALRLVILEGAGFAQVGTHIAILSAWALVSFTIALRIFRWS